MKIKNRIYLLLPKKYRVPLKDFYYDRLIFPMYKWKYRMDYGIGNFFNSIALETTTHCNLRCKFCPNSKYERGLLKNKKLMEPSLFKKIIDELAEINYRGLVLPFSYGEPLTDDRIFEFIRYAKNRLPKAKIELNSNGFLLTLDIYKKLINSGLDKLCITQYGLTVPKNLVGIFNYLKANPEIKNIITYRDLNKDVGLSNRGGEIELETSSNYERPICMYPNSALTIDYAGNLVLCCNDYHSSIIFGNLKETKLITLLRNSDYQKVMKEIQKKKYRFEICKKCVGIIK